MLKFDSDRAIDLVNRISFALDGEDVNDVAVAVAVYIGLHICSGDHASLDGFMAWLKTAAKSAIDMRRKGKLTSHHQHPAGQA